jgi:hypothetical protein
VTDLPRLAHIHRDPVEFDALVVETADDHQGTWQPNWPPGTERRVLGRDPTTGGSTTLLTFPAGYDRAEERELASAGHPQRFEYHSCHEEIVSIAGDYVFGDPQLYRFDAPAYLNHPPFWLHPARQRSVGGVLLLVRNSHPVDFGFCEIPLTWDGREHYLEAAGLPPSPSEAVTVHHLEDRPLAPIAENGVPLPGVRGERLWTDEVTGWQTWLLEAQAGSTLAAGAGAPAPAARTPRSAGSGDEWFILEGQVGFGPDEPHTVLDAYGYRCDPARYPAGGDRATARAQTRLLRWVRGGHLQVA